MAGKRGMLGKSDLSGLNGFGGHLSPLTGALIGGGVSFVSSIAAGHTKAAKNADLIGLGFGLATAGAMYAMKSTKQAAVGAAIGAVLATGLSWLKSILFKPAAIAAAAGTSGYLGIPQIRELNGGLGMPSVRALNGLGIPSITSVQRPVNTIPGVAGNQLSSPGLSAPPVNLLGAQSPMSAQLLGMGGPQVHGLSASYGATLLGGGR